MDGYLIHAKRQEGIVLGAEGCGTIISVGAGISESRIGEKVAFLHDAWGTHCVKEANKVFSIHEDTDLKTAANMLINPLTVLAQLDHAKRINAKAVIMTAAASALAK